MGMNTSFCFYYALVNVIDGIALRDAKPTTEELTVINTLSAISDTTIEDFADANNVTTFGNWTEVIQDFKRQFETGERE